MTDDHEQHDTGLVISIVGRLPSLPDDDGEAPELVSKREKRCNHFYEGQARIDEPNRRLWCGACGSDIDPYEYIGWLAHTGGDRLLATRKRYKALVKRLNEMLHEEKKLKARVRRWRAKGERDG